MVEIVISRYKEDLAWTKDIPMYVLERPGLSKVPLVRVYNKNNLLNDPYLSNTAQSAEIVNLANHQTGREAHTYLYHIIAHYYTLADTTIFMQGHPFDHNPDILSKIRDYDSFNWLNENWHTCDANGCPHHCNLPVGMIYEGLFNEPFPGEITFIPGAQFAVTRNEIQRKPLVYYERLAAILETTYEPWYAWAMERFWRKVFE